MVLFWCLSQVLEFVRHGASVQRPLQPINVPLSGKRKAYFEKIRKERIPRYLFRAWSSTSGGGPTHAINSTVEIVPHRFMVENAAEERDFWTLTENDLLCLAEGHFLDKDDVVSGFSSWASSLHLVLCYAKSMHPTTDPHIAVMDTHNLSQEALVWQLPYLLDQSHYVLGYSDGKVGHGNEEFLAWGPIRGKGYKAVRVADLEEHGLFELLPPLKDDSYREIEGVFNFGFACRSRLFGGSKTSVTPSQLRTAERIASLFGDAFLPTFIALLCLEPRTWFEDAADRHFVQPPQCFLELLSAIIEGRGASEILDEMKLDNWLHPKWVDTRDFPEVQQWIALLRALVQHRALVKAREKEGKSALSTLPRP